MSISAQIMKPEFEVKLCVNVTEDLEKQAFGKTLQEA